MIFRKKPTVLTHNGKYHADDLFAVATLELALNKNFRLVRSRDPKKIADAEYVLDVGGVYSPTENRFDHHQSGGAGKRENGIPYAAFGLVWKKFGEKVCGSKDVARMLDERFVTAFDAIDNGVSTSTPVFKGVYDYSLHSFLQSYLPTWKESEPDYDKIFKKLLPIVRGILEREIARAKMTVEAQGIVMGQYEKSTDKRLLILDKRYPWGDFVRQCPELLFVIYPDSSNDKWSLSTVRKDDGSFEARRNLPQEWAGKEAAELQKITGVADVVFAHNARCLAVAKSKEGALALAKIALQ